MVELPQVQFRIVHIMPENPARYLDAVMGSHPVSVTRWGYETPVKALESHCGVRQSRVEPGYHLPIIKLVIMVSAFATTYSGWRLRIAHI